MASHTTNGNNFVVICKHTGAAIVFRSILFALVVISPPSVADLLVTNNDSHQILRYDDTTGAFLGVFASGGGLVGPAGMVIGPDGNVYVSSETTNSIKRFDGTTGAYIDDFISPLSGGLRLPYGLEFGPDNNLLMLLVVSLLT